MPLHSRDIRVHELEAEDVPLLHAMNTLFGEVFGDAETYTGARPTPAYLERLLRGDSVIALAALDGCDLIGGLVAYELHKFEQARSEIYVYDLAVAATHRRRGIATALIQQLQRIAAVRRAWVIFVQADRGDEPAIRLYSKLGRREDVLHFDIPVCPATHSTGH